MKINSWDDKVAKRLLDDSLKGVGMPIEEPLVKHLAETAIDYGENFNIPRFLDLGSGHGRFLHYLINSYKNFRYIGYDSSLAMIKVAQTRYPSYANCFYLKDITLSFIHKADIVVINEVLIHLTLEDQIKVLRNIEEIKPSYVLMSIQIGNSKTEVVSLEGNEFYNQIQDKEVFIKLLNQIFKIKFIETIIEKLIPSVNKLNIYLELEG